MIRILVLQPGLSSDPLAGEILHVELEDNPLYEALSYVWGYPTPTTTITTPTGPIPITSNLAEALRHIRSMGETPRFFGSMQSVSIRRM